MYCHQTNDQWEERDTNKKMKKVTRMRKNDKHYNIILIFRLNHQITFSMITFTVNSHIIFSSSSFISLPTHWFFLIIHCLSFWRDERKKISLNMIDHWAFFPIMVKVHLQSLTLNVNSNINTRKPYIT